MREKLLWFAVTFLGLLVFARGQTSGAPNQVGRYQLVTVAGNEKEAAQTFRIDTVTGNTWALNGQLVLMPLSEFQPKR